MRKKDCSVDKNYSILSPITVCSVCSVIGVFLLGKKYFISDSLNENNITRKIFYDTEELKENREKDKYAVIMKDGINIYEGIQERQDACIKVNVLNNTNIWVQFNSKSKKKIEKLIKTGLVNKYGIPLSYEEMSQEQWKVFTKIIKNEEGEKIE